MRWQRSILITLKVGLIISFLSTGEQEYSFVLFVFVFQQKVEIEALMKLNGMP